jgi:Ras GTPase-activating-like protein IQGAP2/3
LDKYIAVGRTQESAINISLNEMYFVHSLFNQHLDAVAYEGTRNDMVLKEILTDLGVAPPQLPRKENANVDLLLERSIETNLDEVSSEQLYSDTKLLLLTIIKSLPPGFRASNIRQLIQNAIRTAQSTGDEVRVFLVGVGEGKKECEWIVN